MPRNSAANWKAKAPSSRPAATVKFSCTSLRAALPKRRILRRPSSPLAIACAGRIPSSSCPKAASSRCATPTASLRWQWARWTTPMCSLPKPALLTCWRPNISVKCCPAKWLSSTATRSSAARSTMPARCLSASAFLSWSILPAPTPSCSVKTCISAASTWATKWPRKRPPTPNWSCRSRTPACTRPSVLLMPPVCPTNRRISVTTTWAAPSFSPPRPCAISASA